LLAQFFTYTCESKIINKSLKMKRILPAILATALMVFIQPILANIDNKESIKINYNDSSQAVLSRSPVKLNSTIKTKVFNELYRKQKTAIEFIGPEDSFVFPTAEDIRIHFGNNKFQDASFHLVDTKTWLPWSKIQPQIEELHKTLNSNKNLKYITKTSLDKIKFPDNKEYLHIMEWNAKTMTINVGVQKSTLPKTVLPRNEDLYRVKVIVTANDNQPYSRN